MRGLILPAVSAILFLGGCYLESVDHLPVYEHSHQSDIPDLYPDRPFWGPDKQVRTAIETTFSTDSLDTRTFQNDCILDETRVFSHYDTLVTPYGFKRIDLSKLWTFNHDEDRGSTPIVRAWLRDRPGEDEQIERNVLVILYESAPDSSGVDRYRVLYARGNLIPGLAQHLRAWRAPGAPGFDSQLMPPRVYPDSLRVELQEPITKFGSDAYGRTRGWTIRPLRAPICPPD